MMSDLRAQKLEAARKQLKAYQSKPKNKKEKHDQYIMGKENIVDDNDLNEKETNSYNKHSNETSSGLINQTQNETKNTTTEDNNINNNAAQVNNHNESPLKSYFHNNNASNDAIFDAVGDTIEALTSFPNSGIPTENTDKTSVPISSFPQYEENIMQSNPNIIHELEAKLQEVSNLYMTEKNVSQELNMQLQNTQSNFNDIKLELEKMRLTHSSDLTLEMSTLKEQLQTHIQTVGVLVGEKAELTATVNHFQQLARGKGLETDELQSRLNASRYRVQELEKELNVFKQSNHSMNDSKDVDKIEMEQLKGECDRFKAQFEDTYQHLSEYKEKLILKNYEISELQGQLSKQNSDLNSMKIKLEQLNEDDCTTSGRLEYLNQQILLKDKHISELQESLTQMNTDRENSNIQYQNFVLHLNQEVKTLAGKIEELTGENIKLSKREENLVKHISELEKQLQHHLLNNAKLKQNKEDITIVEDSALLEDREKLQQELTVLQNEVAQLKSAGINIQKQQETLQITLEEKNTTINDMQFTIERLQQEKPDAAKLIAEMESDKVAASRAVLQNQDLKSQLEEMQRAFVQMSNDKLDLTDKLQTEQHLCREMKTHYNQMETELSTLRDKLHFKDEEMIRLAHENTELTKQNYLHCQELDQLRHYEAKSSVDIIIQTDLQKARAEILELQNKILNLENIQNKSTSPVEIDDGNTCKHEEKDYVYEIISLKKEKEELVKALNDFQNNRSLQINTNLQNDSNEPQCDEKLETMSMASTTTIPNHEAMEKLQERFKRTMTEIADMTEEKHRLEHLVLQLQGETETIGEYITLYQNQRRLLKQKEIDRDMQLKHLAIERKLVNDKLNELKYLVEKLIADKSTDATKGSSLEDVNLNNEKMNVLDIAEKILAVFHDIKSTTTSSSSVQNQLLGGVHLEHCSCCSGRLETV